MTLQEAILTGKPFKPVFSRCRSWGIIEDNGPNYDSYIIKYFTEELDLDSKSVIYQKELENRNYLYEVLEEEQVQTINNLYGSFRIPDDKNFIIISNFNIKPRKGYNHFYQSISKKCDCGASAINSGGHSHWCSLNET